jgi:hypothetical protein
VGTSCEYGGKVKEERGSEGREEAFMDGCPDGTSDSFLIVRDYMSQYVCRRRWMFSIVLGDIKRSTLTLYSINDHHSSIVSHIHVYVHDHTSCSKHSLSSSIPPLFFFQKQINQRNPDIPRSRGIKTQKRQDMADQQTSNREIVTTCDILRLNRAN